MYTYIPTYLIVTKVVSHRLHIHTCMNTQGKYKLRCPYVCVYICVCVRTRLMSYSDMRKIKLTISPSCSLHIKTGYDAHRYPGTQILKHLHTLTYIRTYAYMFIPIYVRTHVLFLFLSSHLLM